MVTAQATENHRDDLQCGIYIEMYVYICMYMYMCVYIAFFKTASHTIHNFHINLHCPYFLTDQHSHFKQKILSGTKQI